MNVEVLSEDKHDVELKIDSVTIAEVLRMYLSETADFAAWRREHPSKPVTMRIKSEGKTVQKAVSEAVAAIKKDCDKVLSVVKK